MSQTPTADSVIPVLNEARVLRKSVKTVLDFSHANLPYRWQIVIVDDGSTDGTQDVTKELVVEHPDEVRFLHLQQRGRGPGVAARMGAE